MFLKFPIDLIIKAKKKGFCTFDAVLSKVWKAGTYGVDVKHHF